MQTNRTHIISDWREHCSSSSNWRNWGCQGMWPQPHNGAAVGPAVSTRHHVAPTACPAKYHHFRRKPFGKTGHGCTASSGSSAASGLGCTSCCSWRARQRNQGFYLSWRGPSCRGGGHGHRDLVLLNEVPNGPHSELALRRCTHTCSCIGVSQAAAARQIAILQLRRPASFQVPPLLLVPTCVRF